MNSKGPTARHIIVILSKAKDKEQILKTAREANHHMLGRLNKIICRFLRKFGGQKTVGQCIQRGQRRKTSMKGPVSGKLSFKNEGEIEIFTDKSWGSW